MTSKLARNATDALDGSQGHHICIKYLGIILFCRNSREILHCWLCSWMNKPPTHPHTPEMNTEEGHLGNAFAHSATEITHKTTSAKWKMCPPKVLLHLKITPHWPHSTSSSKLSLFKKNISSHSIWLVLSTFSSNETVFVEPLYVKLALTSF